MSKNIRIIPRLDIKGPNLVKGIHLEGLRVLGSPEEFARFYYEMGADELIYMDIVASLYNRNSLHDFIVRTAKEIFIPLTVGGGLRTIEDMRAVLRSGADKVCLNTAAVKNPDIISRAARKFGSSTVVISVEAIREKNGQYFAYTDNGREYTGIEVLSWVKRVEELGAGEIMITSVDREGTGSGYDLELTKVVSEAVSIPVIACGGAGSIRDIEDVITIGQADAVCLASLIHYDFISRHEGGRKYDEEGNVEFLESGRKFSSIQPVDLNNIKSYLSCMGYMCRNSLH